jgi:hypothetical protein
LTDHVKKGDGDSIAFFINTNALNEMLKRVQHDKKKYVIPNLFRNLEFGNNNKLIAFVLVQKFWIPGQARNDKQSKEPFDALH